MIHLANNAIGQGLQIRNKKYTNNITEGENRVVRAG